MALAVLLSATSEYDSPDLGFTSTDISDGHNKTDVLVHLGVGMELALTESLAAFIDVRYSRSVRNMYKQWDNQPNDHTLYTSDVMLLIGVVWE